MDTIEKIKDLSINMRFEAAEDVNLLLSPPSATEELKQLQERFPVTTARLPNGKTIPLLKTMQTSVCERDCNYCCFRSGRDTKRVSLTPDELASAVVQLSKAGVAKGVFLSSGIAGGGIRTQDRLIDTADILRHQYHYSDYIHLKIMPGAEEDQIFKAMQLADRVSINLEAPNEVALHKLAPHKVFFDELLEPLRMIDAIRKNYPPHLAWKQTWPSSCTQFVVGAVGETDLDLLQTTVKLKSQFGIVRAYFSGFAPVMETPFENLSPLNPWRQHRLYQAFFLLRDYQFDLEEIGFNSSGNISLEKDPKLTWAEMNLLENPIEVNEADYSQLLKVPGIGPVTAKKLLNLRSYGKIRDMSTLQKMNIPTSRAARFILLDGHRPPYQPTLL